MTTASEISSAQANAASVADTFVSSAKAGLLEIKANVGNALAFVPTLEQPTIDYSPPRLATGTPAATPIPPNLPNVPTLPTTGNVTLGTLSAPVGLTLPERPATQDVSINAADLLASLPTITTATAPSATTVTLPSVPVLNGTASLKAAIANEPVLAAYAPPTKPLLATITDPVYLPYTEVSPFTPTSSFIGIAATLASAMPDQVPSSAFDFVPEPISVDELDSAMRDALRRGISGNGFATSEETLALKAGEGKMADAIAAAGERSARELSARGFPAPSGLLLAASRRAANDARREFAQTYANVVSEEARMNRADVATAISGGVQLIDMLNKYHMASVEIGYKVAVTLAEFEYKFFDLTISLAKSRDDFEQIRLGYAKAELDYNTQQLSAWRTSYDVNNAIAATNDNILHVYEAQQKAEALKAEIYATDVRVFTKQIDTNSVLLEQYKTVISARALSLESDKSALDLYKSELAGVAAVQQHDKLNVDIYNSTLAGNKLAVDLASTKVDATVKVALASADIDKAKLSAYVAEIGGQEVRARIDSEQQQAILRTNELAIQSQKLTSDIARMTLLAHEAEVGNLLSEYKVATATYATSLQEASRLDTLSINNQRLALDAAKSNAEITLQSSKANVDRAIKLGEMSVGAFTASTEIASRVAGSALSANNTMLELSSKAFT